MKILLADDDVKIHTVVRLWLGNHGHEVHSAYDGAQALQMISQEHFDGLISDVNMPIMRGNDLVGKVLELSDGPELIILLTSRCDMDQLAEQIGSGRVHPFTKPFSPSALVELIDQLGSGKALQS